VSAEAAAWLWFDIATLVAGAPAPAAKARFICPMVLGSGLSSLAAILRKKAKVVTGS
jgi:hypothetical protein